VGLFSDLIPKNLLTPKGSQGFVIKRQVKEKMRVTMIFLVRYSDDIMVCKKA
jgi:hypothetical protein